MGCVRPALIEKPNLAVGLAAVEVCEIPKTATEGQMTFYNHGATVVTVRLAQTKGSKDVSLIFFTLYLAAGSSYSEDGLVPGVVLAISDGAAGVLSTYVSYR